MSTPTKSTGIPQWYYNFYDIWDNLPFKSHKEAVKFCWETMQTSAVRRKILSVGDLHYIAVPKY